MNPSLPEIYRHLEWADGLIWTSVVAASVDGADEALLTTLHHAHIAQRAFLQLWTGEPVSVPQLDEFANPSDLMAWARGYHTEVQAFLHTAPDLDRLVEVPWGGQFAERHGHPMTHATLGQTAFQVAAHTGHHRGQVTRRLRELGIDPPTVDYIVWIWIGRPEATWPGD